MSRQWLRNAVTAIAISIDCPVNGFVTQSVARDGSGRPHLFNIFVINRGFTRRITSVLRSLREESKKYRISSGRINIFGVSGFEVSRLPLDRETYGLHGGLPAGEVDSFE